MANISKSQAAIRGLQFIWILLITALIGNVLAGKIGTSSAVNYAMFVAAFCWIVWLFGVAAIFYSGLAIPIVLFVMDILAAIFTFIAGVVLAAKLGGGHSCNNENYTRTNSIIRQGGSPHKRCRELQASTAFFWFLWACFMASLIITAMQGFKNGGGMGRVRQAKSGMQRQNQNQNQNQNQGQYGGQQGGQQNMSQVQA